MNKIKYMSLMTLLALTIGLGCSSCEDYLTITPTNSIVEEEYWEDKNDLQNGVTACYKRLIASDMLHKYAQWGELRSDNFEKTLGVTDINVNNVMNANLLSTNSMFEWTGFYNEINYCNKILTHGPEIIEKDESFSQGDWQPIRAEAIALRALCHFYLVRTFGEVPYVTQDYNNDSQDFLIGQSTQIQVLDSIIMDLESIASTAMNDYGNTVDNKGRITKTTVHTLLADVYLWRASYKAGLEGQTDDTDIFNSGSAVADYQHCIEHCDWVINKLTDDYKKQLNDMGAVLGGVEDLELADLFIQNGETKSSLGTSLAFINSQTPYNAIFGSGNSRESIFELQIDGTKNSNGLITSYFYNLSESKTGTLVCASSLLGGVDANPNSEIPAYLFTKTDYRRWETAMYTGANQTDYPLAKYTERLISQYNGTAASGMRDNSATTFSSEITRQSNPNSSNWIVYRLSDVVLMKAEAMTQLYTDATNLHEAFDLVDVVFQRSNPAAYDSRAVKEDSIQFSVFNTPEALEHLVLSERQREFFGEGKRWFDLVRYAQRKGNTNEMLKLLTRKYGDSKKAIEAKLSSLKSLFSPIHNNELKNNPLLHQNEVWGTTESTSKTDDI